MAHRVDQSHPYTESVATDISKTFKKERARLAKLAAERSTVAEHAAITFDRRCALASGVLA